MSAQEVSIDAPDGKIMGYLSTPASGSGPGLVVIQEIFGVNDVMRAICDEMATKGFVALCPDLFWRHEPGIQLTDKTDSDMQKAFDLYGKFDVDDGIEDIKSSIAYLRKNDACTGKIGAMGYCLGGLLAYLTATRTDVDASVGFYGVGIQDKLNEQANIKGALLLHIAEEDEFVPGDAQAQIKESLASNDQATLYSYPGQSHAFARVGGQHYNAEAANLANARSFDFLKSNLGS